MSAALYLSLEALLLLKLSLESLTTAAALSVPVSPSGPSLRRSLKPRRRCPPQPRAIAAAPTDGDAEGEKPAVSEWEKELHGNADEGDDILFDLGDPDGDAEDDADLEELDDAKVEAIRVKLKEKYLLAMDMIDVLEFPENIPEIKSGTYVAKKKKHSRDLGPTFWDDLPPKKQKKVVNRARNEFIDVMNKMNLAVPGFILKPKIAKLAKAFRESLTLDYAKRYCRLMKKSGLSKEQALAALERDGLPSKGAAKAYRSLAQKALFGVALGAVVAAKTAMFVVGTQRAIAKDGQAISERMSGKVAVVASINPLAQLEANVPLATAGKVIFIGALVGGAVMYAASSTEDKYCKPYDKMYNQLVKAQGEVTTQAFKDDGGCCCCCCC